MTWNKTGLAYIKGGVDTWELAFQGQMQACEFGAKFEAWMNTTGKMICLNSKTRMNLYSVLGTREEDTSSAVARQRLNDDEDDKPEMEIIVDYDTDTSGDKPFGGGESGNKKPAARRDTSVNETGGDEEEEPDAEEEEPDANVEGTTVVMSPPVVPRATQQGGNVDRDESQSHRLRDMSRLTPPCKGDDESPVQGCKTQKRNNAQAAEGGGRKKRKKK